SRARLLRRTGQGESLCHRRRATGPEGFRRQGRAALQKRRLTFVRNKKSRGMPRLFRGWIAVRPSGRTKDDLNYWWSIDQPTISVSENQYLISWAAVSGASEP